MRAEDTGLGTVVDGVSGRFHVAPRDAVGGQVVPSSCSTASHNAFANSVPRPATPGLGTESDDPQGVSYAPSKRPLQTIT